MNKYCPRKLWRFVIFSLICFKLSITKFWPGHNKNTSCERENGRGAGKRVTSWHSVMYQIEINLLRLIRVDNSSHMVRQKWDANASVAISQFTEDEKPTMRKVNLCLHLMKIAEKVKRKLENNFGDAEEISEGAIEERKKEKQQETCNQQFLRIIETMTGASHLKNTIRYGFCQIPGFKKSWNKQSLKDTVSTRKNSDNVSQVPRRNAKKATPRPTKYVRLRDLSNKRNAIKKNWSTWLVLILVVCDLNSRYVEQICRLA